MLLNELFAPKKASYLAENLSKGSMNVLSDKRLVAKLASQLRQDRDLDFQTSKALKRAPDEDVAKFFLDKLDAMARVGYGGVIYDRDGSFNKWISEKYANGSDRWEDIITVLPEALRDYVVLKRRNILPPDHNDVQVFKGAKDLKRYMVTHYGADLEQMIKDAEMNGIIKTKRAILIADEPEYRVYLLQNRGAACAFGKGATFCTANSKNDSMWKSYSANAAIFGLDPKQPETGVGTALGGQRINWREKYQFDAGSNSFRDVLDHQVKPEIIKEKFPYLWDDLVKGIKDNKADIEEPEGEEGVEKRAYNVEKELNKLKNNLRAYWTDEKRPAPAPVEPTSTSEPPQLAPPA